MFNELIDSISYLLSWSWPTTKGEVTEVLIERLNPGTAEERLQVAVAYQFYVDRDGPYTGESFWTPLFSPKKRAIAARKKFRRKYPVLVRYRKDDPSVNRLDRSVWKEL